MTREKQLALVLLIWIYFYTLEHPEDEAAFAAVFNKGAEDSATAESTSTAPEALKSEFAKPEMEESEF